MNIREMTAEDISALCCMDKDVFTDPWSEGFFLDELGKDYSYCCVLENDGELCGYAVIWCIYETAELVRIAIDKKYHRNGFGGIVMQDVLQTAVSRGCERMMLEVRKSNAAAQALYKRFGFDEIAIRKRYYGGTEDAVIMEREIKE